MRRHTARWPRGFALPVCACLLFAAGLRAGETAALHVGDPFPQLLAQTLTGKAVQLPAGNRAAIVIFSFSRAAGQDVRRWNAQFFADFAGALPDYTVILLESVPKPFRGMAASGIRSGMPTRMQDTTILLDHEEQLWKQRLAASDDGRAYVVLLAPDGRMEGCNSASFSALEYARLKRHLELLLRPAP